MSAARKFPRKGFDSTFTGKRSSPFVATPCAPSGERPPALATTWMWGWKRTSRVYGVQHQRDDAQRSPGAASHAPEPGASVTRPGSASRRAQCGCIGRPPAAPRAARRQRGSSAAGFEPSMVVEALARPAVPIAARVVDRRRVAAGVADGEVPSERGGATAGEVAAQHGGDASGDDSVGVHGPVERAGATAEAPLVRYHGVVAPNSPWRVAVVPRPPVDGVVGCAGRAASSVPQAAVGETTGASVKGKGARGSVVPMPSGRIEWARLMWRVWAIDPLLCPRMRRTNEDDRGADRPTGDRAGAGAPRSIDRSAADAAVARRAVDGRRNRGSSGWGADRCRCGEEGRGARGADSAEAVGAFDWVSELLQRGERVLSTARTKGELRRLNITRGSKLMIGRPDGLPHGRRRSAGCTPGDL